MANYEKIFEPYYEGGWEAYPLETTLITAGALNDYDAALMHIEDYLSESDFVDWKTFNVLGAKNLLNLKDHALMTTSGNITYTVNSDGSVSVGASTANANAYFPNDNLSTKASSYYHLIPNTKYIVSFGVVLDSTTYIQVYKKLSTDADWTWVASSNTGTSLEFTTDINASYIYWIRLCYISGKSVSATTLYPMIRLASISDATFEPYTMTNRELTEAVQQGGGGGSSTLAGLTDTNITTPTDGQFLVYDSASSKWVNMTIPNAESEGF